ncbi:hypothetical protein KKHLCK_12065 [Candidatus Electrothrix laxa]
MKVSTVNKKKKLLYLAFLPSDTKYQDRFKLFCQIGKRFDAHYIFIGRFSHKGDKNINIIHLQFSKLGFFYNALKASFMLNRLLKDYPNHEVVIQDTFGYLLPFFIFRIKRKNCLYCSAAYSPASYFIDKISGLNKNLTLLISSREIRSYFLSSIIQKNTPKFVDHFIIQAKKLIPYYQNYSYSGSLKNNYYILQNCYDELFWNQREHYSFKYNPVKIVHAGNLTCSKGTNLLPKITKLAAEKNIKINFKIAGSWFSKKEKQLNEIEINKLNVKSYFDFCGRVTKKKLKEIYSESDLFLFPSIFEGSPRVLLEAAACGIPIIARRLPGIIELDKKEAFFNYINDDDELNSIIDLITHYIESPETFISKARKGAVHIRDNFSTEHIANKYYAFYKKQLDQKTY